MTKLAERPTVLADLEKGEWNACLSLGVPENATYTQIRAAYDRQLAALKSGETGPDRAGEIQAAYEHLQELVIHRYRFAQSEGLALPSGQKAKTSPPHQQPAGGSLPASVTKISVILLLPCAAVALAGALIGEVKLASNKLAARNAENILHAVEDAKSTLHSEIVSGQVPMPEGFDMHTIGTYRPSPNALAPIIRSHAGANTVMNPDDLEVGTGHHTFQIGSFNEEATCNPPVPPDQKRP